MKIYRVMVPVLLELEVMSAAEPDQVLASVMESFKGGSDPLLGANIRFDPRRDTIARCLGARLFGGRAYLADNDQ